MSALLRFETSFESNLKLNITQQNINRSAIQTRAHKERSQPAARSKWGLLEKHKDYVLRARDYHKKENTIKLLKSKAAMRNPDEFYFSMIHSKTKKGVHIVQRNEKYSHELLQLLKTQDQNYIHYQKGINSKVGSSLISSLPVKVTKSQSIMCVETGKVAAGPSSGQLQWRGIIERKPFNLC